MKDSTLKILGICGIIVVFIIICILAVGIYYVGTANTLVEQDTAVEKAVGEMQTQYQRRADLIPDLVKSVEASAKFESKTYAAIAGLRSQAISGQQMMQNAQTVEDIQAANNVIDSTLSRLMVVVEAYPELKSTEAFENFNTERIGTESRVAHARGEYNDAVEAYRNTARKIPSKWVAESEGFSEDKWKMYEAEDKSGASPIVSFSI